MFKEWVADVTLWEPQAPDLFCFCPFVDGEVVFALNLLADKPPGRVVGIVHAGGQKAVDDWCARHPAEVEALTALSKKDIEQSGLPPGA